MNNQAQWTNNNMYNQQQLLQQLAYFNPALYAQYMQQLNFQNQSRFFSNPYTKNAPTVVKPAKIITDPEVKAWVENRKKRRPMINRELVADVLEEKGMVSSLEKKLRKKIKFFEIDEQPEYLNKKRPRKAFLPKMRVNGKGRRLNKIYEHLVSEDKRHEMNVILQCFRYFVKNNLV